MPNGPTDSVPEGALVPLQPSDAKHVSAFVLDHCSVTFVFGATVPALAVRLTVGAATIDTVTERCVVPPDPVQARPKVATSERGPTLWLPWVDLLPAQSLSPPVAAQLVAFVVVHASVVEPPLATDGGSALRSTVGAAGADVFVPLNPGATTQPGLADTLHS